MMDKFQKKTAGAIPILADVARHAGVSTATVSRCLNSPERVVKKTRERVLAAVHELGYSPNFGARALAAKRTHTIGAIIPTMENAVFARGVQAFQEELREKGFTLLVASSQYRIDLEGEQIKTLVERGADALLLIGHHRSADIYPFLAGRHVPVLVAWAYRDDGPAPSIGFDNKIAMRELAEKVLAGGHRKIGYISAERNTNDRARDRAEGAYAAMESYGLTSKDFILIETSYSIENGANAFCRIMKQPDPPTVVMCGNDVLAVGALLAAKRLGLKVPEEVSITGFDDIELATITDPPLTTVHVPHRDMGRKAAQILIDMIDAKGHQASTKLMTSLRLRGTLGAIAR